jgi:nucleoside-diphosphate-sugar epimerase
VRRDDADDSGLEVVTADLTVGEGWAAAAGCDEVHHVASPIPAAQPDDPDGSSLRLTKAMLDGTMPVVRRQRFGVADVCDVADLHIRAMAAPDAAGQRFLALADGPTISFLEMAQILRRRFGPLAERVPTEEAPGPEPPRLVIHNDRARNELGWRPRPAETTIVETAASLRDLGLLDQR